VVARRFQHRVGVRSSTVEFAVTRTRWFKSVSAAPSTLSAGTPAFRSRGAPVGGRADRSRSVRHHLRVPSYPSTAIRGRLPRCHRQSPGVHRRSRCPVRSFFVNRCDDRCQLTRSIPVVDSTADSVSGQYMGSASCSSLLTAPSETRSLRVVDPASRSPSSPHHGPFAPCRSGDR